MKTIAKLSMAALAAALTASASADDLKLEVTYDAHGGTRIQYRPESPTIAVFAEGQSVGMQMMQPAPADLRLDFRDNGHGGITPQYAVVK